ncbi:MAG: hypothetical protein WD851_03485 [Pirellulales bacterium]
MKRQRITRLLIVGFAIAVSLPARGHAAESNRNEVRSNLDRGGWSVIWGKNFTEADWARGTKAIVESVAAENPGPFLQWFSQTVDENFAKIERNLKDVSRRDLDRWLVQSLKEKKVITYRGLQIEAGFATYNRWNVVTYDEPRSRKKKKSLPFGGWTYVTEFYTERVEKRVSLPNWHQFYIRYKLAANNQSLGGNSGTSGEGSPTGRIDYTLWNDTKEVVRFRLPTGKVYSLNPGEREKYYNTGNPDTLRIHVLNTDGKYRLENGNHKFWWKKDERRIAFDRNYKK